MLDAYESRAAAVQGQVIADRQDTESVHHAAGVNWPFAFTFTAGAGNDSDTAQSATFNRYG